MAIEKNVEEVKDKGLPDTRKVPPVLENVVTSQDKSKVEEVDFDDLLSSAGEFGRYQILLFISTFPFYVYGVCAYFAQMFMTETSANHWCWVPELENLATFERRALAIPIDENARFGYSHCEVYDFNWTEVLITGRKPDRTWTTTSCQNGWEFDKSEIPYPTISSELGWVCENSSNQANAQSIFFFGSMVGGLVFGWVADRFGRLPAIVLSNIVGCVGGAISIFARSFTEFAIYRFFTGMAYDNCMMLMYLLVLEYVAPKYRTLMANVSFATFYSTTVVALPWIALICGHWKTISLVTSLPMALAIFSPFFVPESPRWLLSRGRVDDTVQRVLKISKVNRIEVPPKLIEQFKRSASKTTERKENHSMIEIMKRPLLRKIFILICLEYICCALVFDALVRSIGTLDFNFFVSFSIVSATEFPSMILLAFIMDWLGRRWLATITHTISAIFCILTVFVSTGLMSVMCAVVARFMVNIAYGVAMQWAAELLPTPVRATGISIVHICGFIGTIISPLIVNLEHIVYWLPLVMTGIIAFLGAILAFLLPETAKKDMPHTCDDAEEMFSNQRLWNMPSSVNKMEGSGQVNECFEI